MTLVDLPPVTDPVGVDILRFPLPAAAGFMPLIYILRSGAALFSRRRSHKNPLWFLLVVINNNFGKSTRRRGSNEEVTPCASRFSDSLGAFEPRTAEEPRKHVGLCLSDQVCGVVVQRSAGGVHFCGSHSLFILKFQLKNNNMSQEKVRETCLDLLENLFFSVSGASPRREHNNQSGLEEAELRTVDPQVELFRCQNHQLPGSGSDRV